MTIVANTTPYPWPWDGTVVASRLALLIVGADTRWWARCEEPDSIVPQLHDLVESVQRVGGRAWSVGDQAARVEAATGLGIEALAASGTSGFYGSSLDYRLRAESRDQLLITGWGLEGPVHSTLRAANDRGYECLLVLDASAPVDISLVAASRSQVEMSGGIFGAVGDSTSVLEALSQLPAIDGGTP